MGLVYNPATGKLEEVAEIDSSNYDFGYASAMPTADIDSYLDSFREEYQDENPNMAGFEEEIGAANAATVSNFLKTYGNKALDLFKNPNTGKTDWTKLLALAGGAYAASRPNNVAPTGYQGKIPKYTAERQMLTAPPAGRRPGSGGIDYGGDVTFRDPAGAVVGRQAKGINELRENALGDPQSQYKALAKGGIAGGLRPEGFVVPADVVSHFGNGSSEAGLRLLISELGAEPIKGEGDGMSDSIPTTIGGTQEARVANEEAFIPPEMVKRIGGGDAKKGARKLYAMMDEVREERTGTKKQGKQIDPEKFMPGGSVQRYDAGGTTTTARTTPTGATGSESSLSNWAGDYVTDMMGRGSALAKTPYEAYTGPLTAGASKLQTQAFDMASGAAPSGISNAMTGLANYAPSGGSKVRSANVSSSYVAPKAYKPGEFSTGTFGTEQAQQYMNPYVQSALDPQLAEARRQAEIMRMEDAGRLTKAGAFGGSRQAIMESEGNRNLMDKQNQMLTSGYSTAYDKAMQQFNADQLRALDVQKAREQASQFGYGQASEQARTAADLALRAGTANQSAGLTAAQINSAATTAADANRLQSLLGQGNLGIAQLNQLSSLGATERGIESEGIAADRAQFEEARMNPFKMVQFEQSLLSGMPLSAQSYSMPGTSNLQQFGQGATTVQQALDILSGKTAAAKKP
jgi:hypothetical protein